MEEKWEMEETMKWENSFLLLISIIFLSVYPSPNPLSIDNHKVLVANDKKSGSSRVSFSRLCNFVLL